MKKITVLLFALAFSILTFSQDNSLQEGNNCFTKGDYACAIDKYKEAIKSPDARQKKIAGDNLRQAEKCFELRRMADDAFNGGNFIQSKEYYKSILNENSKDVYVKSRLKEIQNKLFTLAMPRVNISGKLNIEYGESTTLKIEGGSLAGNAVWSWYSKSCGGEVVGTGESIKIMPAENEQYFVRAESLTDTSGCLTVSVKVDPNSKPPERIEGKKSFCLNEKNIPLTVKGGRLGNGAQWSWYQDSVKGKHLGYGQVLLVSPVKKTTYYLVIEGGPNSIAPLAFEMDDAEDKITDPDKISGNTFICEGSSLSLKVIGGTVSSSANWVWYENNLDPSTQIAKGREISITPKKNTNYLVRGEGSCKVTASRSITINVGELSQKPEYIATTVDSYKKNKTILIISGGSLGKNSKWVWYKDNCDRGMKIGEGEKISVKVKKTTSYFARAEGECNKTSCSQISINRTTLKNHFFVNFGVIMSGNTNQVDINSIIEKVKANPVYSITLGKLGKTGWYVRGKFSGTTIYSDDTIEDNQPPSGNNSYFVFTGNSADNRLSITAGLLKPLIPGIYFSIGAGYGKRKLYWEMEEYSNASNSKLGKTWAVNSLGQFEGPEFETGLLIKLSLFNLSFGVNGVLNTSTINPDKVFIDSHLGIGLTF